MKLMNKKLYQYSIIILGFILIIVLIWFRFIRQRLPKDIPFHLTEYGCIILIYILDSYLASGLSRNFSLAFDMEFSLPNMIQFIPYNKKNTFMNDFGTVLQLLENNKVFEEIEDEEGNIRLGEEWTLLKYKKRNYEEFNKQNTLHKT